jgi:hypothetical protein
MVSAAPETASRRYAAMLLFQFRVRSGQADDRRRKCEKRLIVIEAPDARTALRRAKQRGRQARHRYRNGQGGMVYFEFVGVLDLLHLGSECEPDEVWYDICEMVKPMERRKDLVPPESQLCALVEEGGPRRQAAP